MRIYCYGSNAIVQVASLFGVHPDYLNSGAAIEIKMGQGANPVLAGIFREKIVGDVSRTRMIPEEAMPSPHSS